jgi:hypothetical protein
MPDYAAFVLMTLTATTILICAVGVVLVIALIWRIAKDDL